MGLDKGDGNQIAFLLGVLIKIKTLDLKKIQMYYKYWLLYKEMFE
jgi:hypothetical protein